MLSKNEQEKILSKAKDNLEKNRSIKDGITDLQFKKMQQKYSYFLDNLDDKGFIINSQHVITDINTPRPWMHLMGSNHSEFNETFGSFWDQINGGFSFKDSILAGPLTSHKDRSYVPTFPQPADRRNIIIKENSDIWYLSPQPGIDENYYSNYSSHQGVGYIINKADSRKISGSIRSFVPNKGTTECITISLKNNSKKKRELDLFFQVTWDLTVHPSYYFDPVSVSFGKFLPKENALVAYSNFKRNALPRAGFLTVDKKINSFDISGEGYFGKAHPQAWPDSVRRGFCSNSDGAQPLRGLVGAIHLKIVLTPNRTKKINILCGSIAQDDLAFEENVKQMRNSLLTKNGVDKAFQDMQTFYKKFVSSSMVACDDLELERNYNVWLKYQSKNASQWVRALDQFGYRDVLQDLLGTIVSYPEMAKTYLPVILKYQLPQGNAIRQFYKYENTSAPNDERLFGDSALWIIDTLCTYLEETGDKSILKIKVPFYDIRTHQVNHRNKATIYEHAIRAIEYVYTERGQKGLAKVGYGDWNDAIDALSKEGKGVSIMLSCLLVYASNRFKKIAQWIGDTKCQNRMVEIAQEMKKAVNKYGWDKDHYIFGFNDEGNAIGKGKCEGRVNLTVNSWALFSGAADYKDRASVIIKTFKKLDSPLGAHILDKPYTYKSRKSIGRISDKAQGLSENGSIYTHAQTFMIMGLLHNGKREKAYAEIKKILPGATLPDISTAAPHQLANYTAGKFSEHYGRQLFSNFTGACSWLIKCLDNMFGVRGGFDSIIIDPNLPKALKNCIVKRRIQGREVIVKYKGSGGVSDLFCVTVNGKEVIFNGRDIKIPLKLFKKGSVVKVEAEFIKKYAMKILPKK